MADENFIPYEDCWNEAEYFSQQFFQENTENTMIMMFESESDQLNFAKFIQKQVFQGRGFSTVMELWNEFRPGEEPPGFVKDLLDACPGRENVSTILVALYALTGAQRI